MFEPNTILERRITWAMSAHIGSERPIRAESLAAAIEGDDKIGIPALRTAIHEMRQRGYLIASGQDGYFLPKDLSEAMAYVEEQLRTPARDMLRTVRRQREAARQQFGGQLTMLG